MEKIATKLKRFVFEFGIVGSITGVIAILPGIGSTLLLTTMYGYSPWLQENKEIGFIAYILVMTFLSGIALLATNILGIIGGFSFGFQIGLLAYILGILGASTVMFLIAKRYASANLNEVLENKPKFKAVQNALLNESILRTFLVLILIRLSPAVPFAATNFVVSASGISFGVFILGTIIGMLPRGLAVVFVGSSLSELDFNQPQELWIIVAGIVATILAVVLISVFSKKALHNMAVQKDKEFVTS